MRVGGVKDGGRVGHLIRTRTTPRAFVGIAPETLQINGIQANMRKLQVLSHMKKFRGHFHYLHLMSLERTDLLSAVRHSYLIRSIMTSYSFEPRINYLYKLTLWSLRLNN